MKCSFFTLAICLSILPAKAEAERFLVPIAVRDISGAEGSVFTSNLLVLNSGQREAVVDTWRSCQILCTGEIAPGMAGLVQMAEPGSNPGLILLTRPADAALKFSLRTQDQSRQADTLGTELPVVPESRMTSRVYELINVPTDGRFRSSLRLYAFDVEEVRAKLIFSELYFGRELARTDVVLRRLPIEPSARLAFKPAYAELHSLVQQFPQLASVQELRIRVEIEHASAPFWAFVSVTNNRTQHITTVTPQP